MRDGMYGLVIESVAGQSAGSVVFQSGRIFGIDEGGALYDGSYTPGEGDKVDIAVTVVLPANVPSVLGIVSEESWSVNLKGSASFDTDEGLMQLDMPIGQPLTAVYRFLRPVPPAA
ncbi:hypothetical protein ACQVP2_33020 [Methylobacterium aquaticum]|jgi:hypothetical protein|nr:hypothetical protein [Methylobacterium aquaticum]